MTLDPQLAQEEDHRLLAEYESCHAEKLAAARHSMLHVAYERLVDTLGVIRAKCKEKWIAVRTHRKRMRDEGIANPTHESKH